ncbi:S41 family peptidase [Hymenobacter sp. DG25B]|uniref:S41 family peptidase n=1 Tax=Hymenobacter sp. DG25B TaxID=1385664 RepID=UPI00066268F2|nr:S41 family peptidase [Hymenobacter sp. DG25B]
MKPSPLLALLTLLALAVPSVCRAQSAGTPPVNILQLMDSLTLRLNQHYVFPEEAQRMAAYVQAQAKKKAYAALVNHPKALVKQLQADLQAAHRDPHLFVEYNPALAHNSRVSPQPTAEEMGQAKKYWKANNYLFKKVEVLPGNIGYFPFTGFVPDLAGAQPTISAALQFLAHTNALVMDLRENMGGSPEMVNLLESYFFQEKMHMNDLINQSTNDTTVFYADPAKVPFTLSMPIYILTSHHTFSGAEDFAYALQQAKRAIVVGETTGGGAHPTKPVSVGQGFVVSIPFARSLNPVTHTDWEGTGVVPDVKVEARQALDKARELALRAQRQLAPSAQEKRQADYLLEELAAQHPIPPVPVSRLQPYTGTYGPLTIYLAGNKLLCKNVEAGNLVTELKPIAVHRFVLDDNAHVEFVKDSKGAYSLIKLYVSDGNVFEERRKGGN